MDDNQQLVIDSGFIFFSFLMVFNQLDEEEAELQDRTAFEEFQNALQCVIASFVEYPQVAQTLKPSFHFDCKSKYRKIPHCVFRLFKIGFVLPFTEKYVFHNPWTK